MKLMICEYFVFCMYIDVVYKHWRIQASRNFKVRTISDVSKQNRKIPKGIQGEKSKKGTASSGKLVYIQRKQYVAYSNLLYSL